MSRSSRIFTLTIVMLVCIVVDQYTKYLAREFLSGGAPIHMIGDIFRLQFSLNPGAFLSIGDALPSGLRYWTFITGPALFLLGAAAYLIFSANASPQFVFALALSVAGGVSNLIDRVAAGGLVTDFLNVGIGRLRTGIFNVADMALTFGVIWILLAGIFEGRRR